jgi:hypothetical protein
MTKPQMNANERLISGLTSVFAMMRPHGRPICAFSSLEFAFISVHFRPIPLSGLLTFFWPLSEGMIQSGRTLHREDSLNKLFNIYVDLCLLRAAPQDLPSSMFLVALTAVIGVITGTVVIVGSIGDLGVAFLAQLLDVVLLYVLVYALLAYTHRLARLPQTMAALFGAGVLVNLVTMPVQLLMGDDPATAPMGTLGVLLYLVVMIWALVIIGHILRHTLETRFGNGMLLAIGYFMLVNWLVQILLPVGP